MRGEIKTTAFCKRFDCIGAWEQACLYGVCVCVCVCVCVRAWLCVCEGKMPPMLLSTPAVWLMDRIYLFFSAEGCWLRDVLTKIWLAKPKTYFITHKTFHLLPRFAERPLLSVADPQPVSRSFPCVALALLCRTRSYWMIQIHWKPY